AWTACVSAWSTRAATTHRTCSPRPTRARTRGRSLVRTTCRRLRAEPLVTPAAVDHRQPVPAPCCREVAALVGDVTVPHRDQLAVAAGEDAGREHLDRALARVGHRARDVGRPREAVERDPRGRRELNL